MTNTVLILGARGRLGAAAAEAFTQAGWQVIAQARGPAHGADGMRWTAAAIADTATLARDAAGASVVLHAANPPYTDWKTRAQPLLSGAIDVAKALNATLLFPGNVYGFGPDMPTALTEVTPQTATTVKGRLRIAMEARLREAAAQGLRSVVLRAGDFFGAGVGAWFDQVMVKEIAKGKFTYPGALDLLHAWAYLPDLARALVAVAQARAGLDAFTALHFAGHTLTGRDWIAALEPLARQAGWIPPHRALRTSTLPWSLIRLAAPLVPTWREVAEMQYLWNTPHTLEGSRYLQLIGAPPYTPLAAALPAALGSLGFMLAPEPRAAVAV